MLLLGDRRLGVTCTRSIAKGSHEKNGGEEGSVGRAAVWEERGALNELLCT